MGSTISPPRTTPSPRTIPEKLLLGYRLTTAEILYRLPDYPDLLQTFLWQDLDLAPQFPNLHGFLEFWRLNLDGKLHSVRLAQKPLVTPTDFPHASLEFRLH